MQQRHHTSMTIILGWWFWRHTLSVIVDSLFRSIFMLSCLTRPYQLSVFLWCFLELRWCSSHATSPFNHILHLEHKKSVWKKNGSSAGCSEDVIGICDGRVSSAGCSRRSWTIEDVKAMWTSTQHQWTCAWKTMSAQRSHETNVRLIAQSWRLFLVNQKWNDCFVLRWHNSTIIGFHGKRVVKVQSPPHWWKLQLLWCKIICNTIKKPSMQKSVLHDFKNQNSPYTIQDLPFVAYVFLRPCGTQGYQRLRTQKRSSICDKGYRTADLVATHHRIA